MVVGFSAKSKLTALVAGMALMCLCALLHGAAPAGLPATRSAGGLPPGVIMSLGGTRLRSGEPAEGVLFAADSKLLLSAHRNSGLHFWDVGNGELVAVAPAPGPAPVPAGNMEVNGDGRSVVAMCAGQLHFWSIPQRSYIRTMNLPPGDTILSFAVSSDGGTMAFGGKQVHIADSRSGQFIGALPAPGPNAMVRCLRFAPGDRLLAASFGSEVWIWDVKGGQPIARIGQKGDTSDRLSWSADGKRLAILGSVLHLYEFPSGKALALPGPDVSGRSCSAMAFAAKGNRLAAAIGNELHIFDLDAGEGHTLTPQSGPSISSLCWSADATLLAWAHGGQLEIWDVQKNKPLFEAELTQAQVTGLAASPDGRRIATVGRQVWLWDAQSGRRIRPTTAPAEAPAFGPPRPSMSPFEDDAYACQSAAYTPDGKVLIVRGAAMTSLWDPKTLKKKSEAQLAGAGPWAMSADGKRLAEAGNGRVITIWDLETGRTVGRIATEQPIAALALSPDGKGVADLQQRTLCAWDVESARPIYRIKMDDISACGISATPDGRFLAAAGTATRLLEAAGGRPVWQLPINSTHVRISSDGALLAVPTLSRVAIVETLTGSPVAVLEGHDGNVTDMAFMPRMRIVTCAADGKIFVWDIAKLLLGPETIKIRALPAEHMWNLLDARNAAEAYGTIALLTGRPDDAIKILSTRLKPGEGPVRATRCMFLLECLGTPGAEKILETLKKDPRFAGQADAAIARMRIRAEAQATEAAAH